MDFLEEIINHIYKHLTNTNGSKTNIIRKHTKNLESLGDLSFPKNSSNWKSLIEINNIEDIFDYLNTTESTLIKSTENILMKLSKSILIKDNVHLYFNRGNCYEKGIKEILGEKSFGRYNLPQKKFYLTTDVKGNLDISELRVRKIRDVTENLIRFCQGTVCDHLEDNTVNLVFSLKSNQKNICLCGAVLNKDGVKDKITTGNEYIKNHIIHMRLMAEHKYGLRVTSKSGWQEFFEKLGSASATIELLQNKISSTLSLNLNGPTISNNKGSSFILYNCARLSRLFKEYDTRVESKIYPHLPPIEEVDFTLLIEPEEWELFFVYVLQFPTCIKNCLRDVTEFKVYPHYLLQHLSGFCTVFSVYYRRVKILIEPREHLFPTLFAKMYLLKTLEQIMHVGLRLLNIEPVRQM